MSTPRTKQDNLQSRLPDPAQFVPEVAEIAAGMFKATQNGSIPQTTINRVQLRAGQIVGSTYHRPANRRPGAVIHDSWAACSYGIRGLVSFR
jgi:hypothetical protein